MDRQIDGWILWVDGWLDRLILWVYRQIDGLILWLYLQMNRFYGQIDRWMDFMARQTGEQINKLVEKQMHREIDRYLEGCIFEQIDS